MLPKGPYNPNDHEDEIYKSWEQGGFFLPSEALAKEGKPDNRFSIVMPPPNVTGVLHIGHALMLAVEDLMVRYNRMLGKRTLWLPGTDHAAIATQNKVEKDLYKQENKTRHDLGRQKFLERVGEYAQNSHDTIVNQTKKMGASCDWSREAFTLDKQRTKAVYTAFKKMYDDGLIFRGHRIVNWDPKMQTTVSDDEVEYKEEKVKFYYFKYGPFEIATARPETKFGDKYVVMHPDDKRYKKYKHGQKIKLEWINKKIEATILKDEVIDMEFGTGAMTITPWHDNTDFELAEKYNLDKEQIIDYNGKLMPIAGEFSGMPIKKAREKIVEKLKAKGLLVKVDENYTHRIATNSRGKGVIEPQIKEQWFVDVNKKFILKKSKIDGIRVGDEVTLKQLMRQVIDNKQINILPDHFKKTYFHWIDNLRDWCISRQIWYGHRIPVWYKDKEIFVGEKAPEGEGWEQDFDTLDTWFSSGLWTFSTLGWPKETQDLKDFHPTDVMETGYDILFFWVARMILMTTYLLGEIPFKTVYLHGLIRDEDKKKMSKSSGNAVDPLGAMEEFGTDALRMALVFSTSQGNDVLITKDKILAQKKFANKIWNASKFVLINLQSFNCRNEPWRVLVDVTQNPDDKEILAKLDCAIKQVTKDINNFMFHEAAQNIYNFFWHDFCDEYLESVKSRLSGDDLEDKKIVQNTLYYILSTSLILLHPFMPFITEKIWSELPGEKDMLIIQKWPG
ncbi:valine--tRNA ligase [Patescibacteria group bacterium]|nr:valine--tRNA ligase [Patescibacteria group bacterium]